MKPSRRTFMQLLVAAIATAVSPKRSRAGNDEGDVRHILPVVTDTSFSISVSFFSPRTLVSLAIGERTVAGESMDTDGQHWSFNVHDLMPDTPFVLQLVDESGPLGEPWTLKSFPSAEGSPSAKNLPFGNAIQESFKLLAFTCAGGADGFGFRGRQFFKPHAFRQKLFDEALAERPDAAIAIGDHIYWDLRGGSRPPVGKKSVVIKYLAGWYLKFKYGEFDRTQPLLGTTNEKVLKRIGNEQIADLYGTRFRSTPICFVADDHDYFENDDADQDMVTFPPDTFSRAAHAAIARLYYPPLPNAPDEKSNRSFGNLVYGRLFESPIFDCAGHLTLEGEQAGLIPKTIEDWLVSRARQSTATHFAFVPSHPFGWTAGKWREWYPDVVAPRGHQGVVINELMTGTEGALTATAEKYLWQAGWWRQHQRLLHAVASRVTSRFIFSGDIHAQGAVQLSVSGELDLSNQPVQSYLVGPVGTSEATWPSSARGIAAAKPQWLQSSALTTTREVNGFALFEFNESGATARLYDCGGFDLSKREDGRVLAVTKVTIS